MLSHNQLMENVKNKLNVIPQKFKHNNIIYLDYPVHHNIGDLLIYLGALKLFKASGISIISQLTTFNYTIPDIEKIIEKYNGNITIYFHGGGNFGDLYLQHQDCRKKVITAFPDTNIIIGPQTLYYKNDDNINVDANVFSKHKDLTLFVRDHKSEKLAEALGCQSFMMPDTAHMLWHTESLLNIKKTTGNGTLNFRRRDIESDMSNEGAFDWADIVTEKDIKFMRRIRKIMKRFHFHVCNEFVAKLWENHCYTLCKKAALKFNQYHDINTDRLHGHILSSLLSKKNTVLDNSYGKNSSYIEPWTINSPHTTLCNSKLNKEA
jgi:pyruvyl transferase EpsO